MIKQETVNEIMETAEIVEVIHEFVPLKKRGKNHVALCPFHSEKTPSFSVSPSKGIFKCFGCGEAGNVVHFLMKHENFSYPEALRYLADWYNIEVQETGQTDEEKKAQQRKESLYIVTSYAQKYYTHNLLQGEEGQKIGQSYFEERGYREHTIKEFELGYARKDYDDFTKKAINNQYKREYLKEIGLTSEKNGKLYDFFRERVIFPIHNLSGKVVAFAGRTLNPKNDKLPKYLNTRESEIYNKSKTLYGLYQAKQSIRQEEECFVVEGYTDVLSMYQSGIENVVASSGTSLTKEQVRLISRYTNNVTMLYDGDEAGEMASLRGIDIILEQGLNVKILALPEDEDPDSMVRELGYQEFLDYIHENKQPFILFKANLLLRDTQDDPTKKAEAIQEIVKSIAQIPDHIKRSLIVKECSKQLEIEEKVLISELNKIQRKELRKQSKKLKQEERQRAQLEEKVKKSKKQQTSSLADGEETQEKDLIRILLQFSQKPLDEDQTVLEYVMNKLEGLQFQNQKYGTIFEEWLEHYQQGQHLHQDHFLHHDNDDIRNMAINLTTSPHSLSENWYNKHDIYVTPKEDNYRQDVYKTVAHFQLRKINREIGEVQQSLKEIDEEENEDELQTLLAQYRQLKEDKEEICDYLGTVVMK